MNIRKFIQTGTMVAVLGLTPATVALADSTDASFENVKQETTELMTELKTYSAEQRDEAVAAVGSALDTLDRKIDALDARIEEEWDEMSADARETSKESMAKLREQRAEVAEWFENLKSSSDDTWEDVKDEVSNAYEDLSDSFSEAWADTKKAVKKHS